MTCKKRQRGTETPSSIQEMTRVCSQVRKKANPSSRLHGRSGECNYFNHAIYCSFFFFFLYISSHDRKGKHNRPRSWRKHKNSIGLARKEQSMEGFFHVTSIISWFFPQGFLCKGSDTYYMRDIRKPSEEKHKIGTLHESKGVEGEGHQLPQMCLIISDLEFWKAQIDFKYWLIQQGFTLAWCWDQNNLSDGSTNEAREGEFTCSEQDHRRVKGRKRRGGGEGRCLPPPHKDSASGTSLKLTGNFG